MNKDYEHDHYPSTTHTHGHGRKRQTELRVYVSSYLRIVLIGSEPVLSEGDIDPITDHAERSSVANDT